MPCLELSFKNKQQQKKPCSIAVHSITHLGRENKVQVF